MISLLTLDRDLWWTPAGNGLKYGLIFLSVVLGWIVARRSRVAYFAFGWLIVIVVPLSAIAAVANAFGARAVFSRPSHEDIFIYGWLGLALVEFFLIWIPILAALSRPAPLPAAAPVDAAAGLAGGVDEVRGVTGGEAGGSAGASPLAARLASAVAAAYVVLVGGSIAAFCVSRSDCALGLAYTRPVTATVIVVGSVVAWGLWHRRRWAWWLAVGASAVQCVRLGLRVVGAAGTPPSVVFWILAALALALLVLLLTDPVRRACSR